MTIQLPSKIEGNVQAGKTFLIDAVVASSSSWSPIDTRDTLIIEVISGSLVYNRYNAIDIVKIEANSKMETNIDVEFAGSFTGTSVEYYDIEVTATDEFKWRVNRGSWTTGVTITGSAQGIGSSGATVNFDVATGNNIGAKACGRYIPLLTSGVAMKGDTIQLISEDVIYHKSAGGVVFKRIISG